MVIRKYKSYNIIICAQMEDETAKDENENRYLKKQRDLFFFFLKNLEHLLQLPKTLSGHSTVPEVKREIYI